LSVWHDLCSDTEQERLFIAKFILGFMNPVDSHVQDIQGDSCVTPEKA